MSELKRDMLMLLLAIALLAATCACVGEDAIPEVWGIQDLKATHRLAPEVQKLRKEMPLPFEVSIVVVHRDCQAWYDPQPKRQIIILDGGHEHNKKMIRHEWTHAWQDSQARAIDDAEARKAER